jgi:hypothetical protein
VPDAYYANYFETVVQYVKDCKGILHEKKYTEYSRVILGLTAAGYDPRSVGGYDLTVALGDFERTVWQGINGPIWALIALDSGNYAIPENKDAKTRATRELYVAEILRRQLPDGGWNLTAGADGTIAPGERSDPDITGMALQALAKYQNTQGVKAATERALDCLSKLQDEKGGYSSWGSENSESVVQVLVALCELGIPTDDPRFVKNGATLVDNILTFRVTDGSFLHTAGGAGNSQMSTEQSFYGLVAAQRARDGKNSLYRMDDAAKRGDFLPAVSAAPDSGAGLPGKHADVKSVPAAAPGKTFADTAGHENQAAIEALAARGVLNGKSGDAFDPDAGVTRAEFAAIVMRALGLPDISPWGAADAADDEASGSPVTRPWRFADVPAGAWYAVPVATAYYYNIASGTSETGFNPGGAITRQEAAVMVARAARLAGMDAAALDAATVRDTLAQFGDYVTAADWARESLAFCYGAGILDDAAFDIRPKDAATRAEIAEMLYRTLEKANLL